jgi:hypothetical protein
MQRLKDPLVGVSIPGFAGGNIDAFYTLALGRLHGPFVQKPKRFNGVLCLRRHPVTESFVKHPFAHIYKRVLQRHIGRLKNTQYGIHYFGAYSIAFGYCNFHVDCVFFVFFWKKMTFIIFSKAAAPSGISTTFSADTPPAAVLALAAAALSNRPGAEPP